MGIYEGLARELVGTEKIEWKKIVRAAERRIDSLLRGGSRFDAPEGTQVPTISAGAVAQPG